MTVAGVTGSRGHAFLIVAVCVAMVLLVRAPGLGAYNALSLVGVIFVIATAPAATTRQLGRLFRLPIPLAAAVVVAAEALSLVTAPAAVAPIVRTAANAMGILGLAATALPFAYAALTVTRDGQRAWGRAFAVAALAAATLHLLGLAGMDGYRVLESRGIAFPAGGPDDVGSRNTLAIILLLTGPVGLFLGAADEARAWRHVRHVAFGIAAVVVGALQARLAMLLFVGLSAGLVIAVRRSDPRTRREALVATVVAAMVMVLAYGVGGRAVMVRSKSAAVALVPDVAVGAALPTGSGRGGAAGKQRAVSKFWVTLFEPYHALSQRLVIDRAASSLWIRGHATAGPDAWLDVELDGTPLRRLVPGRDISSKEKWFQLPLETPLAAGSVHVVSVHPGGRLSSRGKIFVVAAVAISTESATSTFLVNGWPVRGDISPGAGAQVGTALIVAGDVPLIPSGTPTAVAQTKVLDPSLSDRALMWRLAIEHGLQRPWLGWGFNSYGPYFNEMARGRQVFFLYANPHSDYLAVFHDTGLLGLVPMTLIAGLLLFAGARTVWQGGEAGEAAVALAVASVVPTALMQTVFADQRTYALVAVLFGLFLGMRKTGTGEAR